MNLPLHFIIILILLTMRFKKKIDKFMLAESINLLAYFIKTIVGILFGFLLSFNQCFAEPACTDFFNADTPARICHKMPLSVLLYFLPLA